MSMTILALACGGMQVLSSIVWLPLAIFGSRPPAFLSVVFIGSIPWATLGALAFRNRQRMSEFDQVEVVVGCGFTVLCYAGATLFMLELAKARFAALTERTE